MAMPEAAGQETLIRSPPYAFSCRISSWPSLHGMMGSLSVSQESPCILRSSAPFLVKPFLFFPMDFCAIITMSITISTRRAMLKLHKEGGAMSEIKERLAHVMERIETAREKSPYHQQVTLVAVTKFHPIKDMEEAISLGVTHVGENRVQEMEEKYQELSLPVTWHLQGHLQKNKVKKAVAMADLIQSADSLSILREIDKRAAEIDKVQDVLLEFNISGEESKTGLSPDDMKMAIDEAKSLSHVRVLGLMCMAPNYEDVEMTRPVFRKAHEMWEDMKKQFPEGQISILSMGMTHDFEQAIEEGATMVRIGTAIFGSRVYH